MSAVKDIDRIADTERSAARLAWMKARVENIHKNVSVYDVLSKNGIDLAKHGRQEEQISCPFHGQDTHPSARYFPEAESRSHVWCFVCQESWDTIGLWKRFSGTEKFSELLFEIEKAFHLTVPESNLPQSIIDPSNPLREEIDRMLSACEYRLRMERDNFEMETHLKLGALLDQIHYGLSKGKAPLEEIKKRLDAILQKMGDKIRATKTQAASP